MKNGFHIIMKVANYFCEYNKVQNMCLINLLSIAVMICNKNAIC